MPIVCRPATHVPEYHLSLDETLALCRRLHADHQDLPLVLRMLENTGVRSRNLVQPIEQTLLHPGFEARNLVYVREAKARIPAVVLAALENAGVGVSEIQAIVFVSCTGFTMPPLTTWMINDLGFENDTRQIPIAQVGCAAGGAAINRAHDFCAAFPGANVLVVSCEFCSLCYQPADTSIGALLSNGLFGDAITATVVRSDGGGAGMQLERTGSYLIPGTEDWISYDVKSSGFHFRLDKRVPRTMALLAPALRGLAHEHGWSASGLDFYVIHAGGPRILNDLCALLGVPSAVFRHSRSTLTEHGNIASATVLEALRRQFDDAPAAGARGMLAGFGPGITAEMSLGAWVTADASSAPAAATHPGSAGRALVWRSAEVADRRLTDDESQSTAKASSMTLQISQSGTKLRIGGDVEVCRPGFGALHLTGPGYWGPPSDPDAAVRLLRRTTDLGVNFIATADSYGPDTNEQLIRHALYPYPSDLIIATKGGLLRSGPDDWGDSVESSYVVPLGRPEYLRQQVEMSLRNLGVERIDLYELHRIDPAVPVADQFGELKRLQEQGKIRHIGVSGQPTVTVDQLDEIRRITEIAAIEVLYNIADRTNDDVLRYAEQNDIVLVSFFPLGHGQLVKAGSGLSRFAADRGMSAARLAIAWLLHRSRAVQPIPGTTSIGHLEDNVAAAEIQLDDDDWTELETLCASELPMTAGPRSATPSLS